MVTSYPPFANAVLIARFGGYVQRDVCMTLRRLLAHLEPADIYPNVSDELPLLSCLFITVSSALSKVASSDESGMIIVWSNPVISAESRFVINEPG